MGSQPYDQRQSNLEVFPINEDFGLLSFPIQPPRLDFSTSSGDAAFDFEYLQPNQESAFDAVDMDTLVYDPPYSVLDFDPTPNNILQGEDFCRDFVDGFRAWDQYNQELMMHYGYNMEMAAKNQQLLLCDGGSSTTQDIMMTLAEEVQVAERIIRRPREVPCSSTLSKQTISRYFYMPITQAARHLNVGLTLLKKRCRELGIRRWPHRKLMSLQTLINTVQEMQNRVGGHMAEKKLRETINKLEEEKKLMEEIPDMKLDDQTKRLRQACFKANYKKRKLVGIMDSIINADEEEEEDFDSIFAACLSFLQLSNVSNVNN